MDIIKRVFLSLASRGYLNWMPDSLYLKMCYKSRTGKKLNLKNPTTFNEKLQWLKLYDHNPEYSKMVDKFEVKKYVTEILGEGYIIPTLAVWDNVDDIDFDLLPNQFVLKCTHDSGGLVICKDKSNLDKTAAIKKIEKSMRYKYFYSGREWPYKNVKPRIIAEQYIEDSNDSLSKTDAINSILYSDLQKKHGLLDYKFMCFDGKVKALFLDIGVIGESGGHAEQYYRNIYDRNGTLLPVKETRDNYPIPVVLPENLSEMIDIAEKLSENIPHLRVDLYRLNNGEIKVGELTFFHGNGMSNNFIPEKWSETFGSWIELPLKK